MPTPSQLASHLVPGRYAAIAIGVAMALVLVMVKLPPGVLDVLLTANLGLAALVLIGALAVRDPGRIPTFPGVLLLTTLLRMALSIAATRLVLLDGEAGRVVDSFAAVVAGGSPVVGAVVFVVLLFVQIVVVTKGGERVAEVAARFALDAMPGKQMAIDADARAGVISAEEASVRRSALERESRLYGSLDGAMKFVRGDALAGVFISLVIVVGGLVVGVSHRGMPWAQAAETYVLLAVGVGLAVQIPSILMSLAAGVVVTRIPDDETGSPAGIAGLLLRNHVALFTVGGLFLLLGAAPIGLPTGPFLLLGIALVAGGAMAWRAGGRAGASTSIPSGAVQAETRDVVVRIDAGEASGRASAEIERAIGARVQAWAQGLGIAPPRCGVEVDGSLGVGAYTVEILGATVATGMIPPEGAIVDAPPESVAEAGVGYSPCVIPGTRVPAAMVAGAQADAARRAGFAVLDRHDAIGEHVASVLGRRGARLVGVQCVGDMVKELATSQPELAAAVTPGLMGLPRLTEVVRRLVSEGVPILPRGVLFEALAKWGGTVQDAGALVERIRREMAGQICSGLASERGRLAFYSADPELENLVSAGADETAEGTVITLSRDEQRRVVDAFRGAVDPARHRGGRAVVLVSGYVRRPLRTLLEQSLPDVAVLAYEEVSPDMSLERLGLVMLGQE
ncbi:MAG: FHIPEP family type III secretion protein [Phycisphaeraceae bacterium]|nr:FHIPEP family type III secretion protein [Phycisphaeraceae bacterium]